MKRTFLFYVIIVNSICVCEECGDESSFITCKTIATIGVCGKGSNMKLCAKSCGACKSIVHGGYSVWGNFQSCSKSCGYGDMMRERTCTDPTPSKHGNNCTGHASERKPCFNLPCPVHGGFTSWSKGPCSKTCGQGTLILLRHCKAPTPAYGGRDCSGPTQKEGACFIKECPIHGGFTSWSNGPCSKTCGLSKMIRIRNCTLPRPQYGGRNCSGPTQKEEACFIKECPIHGGFSSWSNYGPCSQTCGEGVQMYDRDCTNPVPMFSGNPCIGMKRKEQVCKIINCPSHWMSWLAWASCSLDCGPGFTSRQRICHKTSNDTCIGNGFQVKECFAACASLQNLVVRNVTLFQTHIDRYWKGMIEKTTLLTSLGMALFPIPIYISVYLWIYSKYLTACMYTCRFVCCKYLLCRKYDKKEKKKHITKRQEKKETGKEEDNKANNSFLVNKECNSGHGSILVATTPLQPTQNEVLYIAETDFGTKQLKNKLSVTDG